MRSQRKLRSTRSAAAAPKRARMSNSLSALMSATFYERGYDHHVEIIHQRDAEARRRLESLEVTLYDGAGALLATPKVDPAQDILDLGALVADATRASERVMPISRSATCLGRCSLRPRAWPTSHGV